MGGGFIKKGGHQSQGDLVNGKGSSWGTKRRYGREMRADGGMRLCHMLPSSSTPSLYFSLLFPPPLSLLLPVSLCFHLSICLSCIPLSPQRGLKSKLFCPSLVYNSEPLIHCPPLVFFLPVPPLHLCPAVTTLPS